MATVGKFHCVLTDDAARKIQAARNELARKRAARGAQTTVLGMLAAAMVRPVVTDTMPLDNPVINTSFGDL